MGECFMESSAYANSIFAYAHMVLGHHGTSVLAAAVDDR